MFSVNGKSAVNRGGGGGGAKRKKKWFKLPISLSLINDLLKRRNNRVDSALEKFASETRHGRTLPNHLLQLATHLTKISYWYILSTVSWLPDKKILAIALWNSGVTKYFLRNMKFLLNYSKEKISIYYLD